MVLPYRSIASEHVNYASFRIMRGALELACRVSSLIDFRGSYHVARYVARSMPGPEEIVVVLDHDITFSFPKTEPYWLRVMSKSFVYEQEMEHILAKLSSEDFVFIDAGANVGYWSILASSRRFGSKRVIAIEPLSTNVRWISRNWELNGRRFSYVHGALHWEDLGEVRIYSSMSESPTRPGASVVQEKGDCLVEECKCYRFEDLVSGFGLERDALVVKLDVEGIERYIAEDIYRQRDDVLVVYEDHGKDQECNNSRWFLEEFGCVFRVDKSGRFICLTDIEQVRSVKRRASVGYNFISGPRKFVQRMLGL